MPTTVPAAEAAHQVGPPSLQPYHRGGHCCRLDTPVFYLTPALSPGQSGEPTQALGSRSRRGFGVLPAVPGEPIIGGKPPCECPEGPQSVAMPERVVRIAAALQSAKPEPTRPAAGSRHRVEALGDPQAPGGAERLP